MTLLLSCMNDNVSIQLKIKLQFCCIWHNLYSFANFFLPSLLFVRIRMDEGFYDSQTVHIRFELFQFLFSGQVPYSTRFYSASWFWVSHDMSLCACFCRLLHNVQFCSCCSTLAQNKFPMWTIKYIWFELNWCLGFFLHLNYKSYSFNEIALGYSCC